MSYKFKWSPEGTGPGRREVGSQRACGGADSLHPDWYCRSPKSSVVYQGIMGARTIHRWLYHGEKSLLK